MAAIKIVTNNFNFIKLIIFTQFLCHTTFIAILKLILGEEGIGVEILMFRIFWYARNQRLLPIPFIFFPH